MLFRSIKYEAFSGTDLEQVIVPKSVTTLENQSFTSIKGLRHVICNATLDTLYFSNVFSSSNATLEKVNIDNSNKAYYIGVNTTSVENREPLKEIVIGDNVEVVSSISKRTESIKLGNSVREIGGFRDTINLKKIDFPDSLRVINSNTFSGSGLEGSLTIPTFIDTVGSSAFYNCNNLTEVNINGISDIKNLTFAECDNLRQVNIDGAIETIAADAFRNDPIDTIYVERYRSDLPLNTVNLQPWGAVSTTKVYYLGEYVKFDYNVSIIPGEYARNINIHGYSEKFPIRQIILPNDTQILWSENRWPTEENSDYTYKVTSNDTYVFKGTNLDGIESIQNVVINDIGLPTITANDFGISKSA